MLFYIMISNDKKIYSDPKLTEINVKLDDVKNTVVETIDNIMERGEKLEGLVEKTDQLDSAAFQFNRNARKLRNEMLCKKIKLCAIIAFSLSIFIWLVSANICGFDYKDC